MLRKEDKRRLSFGFLSREVSPRTGCSEKRIIAVLGIVRFGNGNHNDACSLSLTPVQEQEEN